MYFFKNQEKIKLNTISRESQAFFPHCEAAATSTTEFIFSIFLVKKENQTVFKFLFSFDYLAFWSFTFWDKYFLFYPYDRNDFSMRSNLSSLHKGTASDGICCMNSNECISLCVEKKIFGKNLTFQNADASKNQQSETSLKIAQTAVIIFPETFFPYFKQGYFQQNLKLEWFS